MKNHTTNHTTNHTHPSNVEILLNSPKYKSTLWLSRTSRTISRYMGSIASKHAKNQSSFSFKVYKTLWIKLGHIATWAGKKLFAWTMKADKLDDHLYQ
jgi:hypothetical protein